MEDLLHSMGQKSGIYSFMHTSWGWPTVESLHFVGLSLLIGCIGLWDLRLLGVARGIPMDALHRLVPWGIGGYVLNLCTGFLFLVSAPNQYLYNPAFQIKLLLMAIAGVNVLVFYRFAFRRVRAAAAEAPAPAGARTAAAVSLACWVGVIVCGRLITYFRPPYHWCFWC